MEKIERIPNSTGAIMLTFALFIDILQALLEFMIIGLILNPLITIITWLIFWLWFNIRGVNFSKSTKRVLSTAFTALVEMTPLSFLPTWSFNTFYLIYTARQEDAQYNRIMEVQIKNQKARQHQAMQAAAAIKIANDNKIAEIETEAYNKSQEGLKVA